MVPMRSEALRLSRRGRGFYECAHCNHLFKRQGVHVDHIEPVIDPRLGFVNWDAYIDRLFCAPQGLQILCKECHQIKTQKENRNRI